MQVNKKQLSDTKVQLTVSADQQTIAETKQQVLQRLGRGVRVPGFRAGKVPLAIAEKYLDQSVLQTEFLDAIANRLYGEAITNEKLRPVNRPEVNVKKFVPFETVEFEIIVETLGEIKLPDYTKIKLARKPVSVTAKDIDEVIENLRVRVAGRKEVQRAAAAGDEVWIDFNGTDAKTGDPIQGADGKDYPLQLGSDTFIPGFEKNIIGMKPGEEKTFTLAFPDDYGVKALQNRKVTFAVKVSKVNAVTKPKADDAFAASAGPFKTLADLKADIKKQLTTERQTQADRDYESELLERIVEQTTMTVPKQFVDDEIERMEVDERRNLTYRGQTWQEHLKDEGLTEAEHREQKRPAAKNRVKAGLILSEIAEKEKLTVTPEEFEIRLQLLKGQYQDKQMQAELDKPENRQDILSRLLTEKTIARLVKYAQKV